jgi:hypothetical protein
MKRFCVAACALTLVLSVPWMTACKKKDNPVTPPAQPTLTPTWTVTSIPSPTPSPSATATGTATHTPSRTASPTPSPTDSPTWTGTPTWSPTSLWTATTTPSDTPVWVPSPTCVPPSTAHACASPGLFGYSNTSGIGVGGTAGVIIEQGFLCGTTGWVNQIEVYASSDTAGTEGRVAIYRYTLLAQSCSQVLLPNQWNTFDVPDVPVTAGLGYSLAYQVSSGGTGGVLSLNDNLSPTPTPLLYSTTDHIQPVYGPFPVTFTGVTIIGDFVTGVIRAKVCP